MMFEGAGLIDPTPEVLLECIHDHMGKDYQNGLSNFHASQIAHLAPEEVVS